MRDILETDMVRVNDLVSAAQESLRKGMIHDAYALSLQATQNEPENIEAWLLRAGLAASLEEKILCVNRMNELGAGQHDTHHVAFFALKEMLDHDPFLAYADETEQLYRVHNMDHTLLSIPKQRSVTVTYPPEEGTNPLSLSHRLLLFAILGLIFAGIGTLIFAPLAAWAAFNGDRSTRPVHSLVVVFTAAGLFIIGAVFSILFLMHWVG
jgi:hypothetical protein